VSVFIVACVALPCVRVLCNLCSTSSASSTTFISSTFKMKNLGPLFAPSFFRASSSGGSRLNANMRMHIHVMVVRIHVRVHACSMSEYKDIYCYIHTHRNTCISMRTVSVHVSHPPLVPVSVQTLCTKIILFCNDTHQGDRPPLSLSLKFTLSPASLLPWQAPNRSCLLMVHKVRGRQMWVRSVYCRQGA